MRVLFLVLLSGAMMAGLSQTGAQAPPTPETDPNAPVYVVGYIDVMPSAKNSIISAFKQFRDACRKEEGNVRCEVVQRLEQPNQFVTLQIWKDKNSLDAHANSPLPVLDHLRRVACLNHSSLLCGLSACACPEGFLRRLRC